MAAAPLRPSPCRWACPTTTSWRHSPHPTRWGSMTRPVYQPGVRFDSAGAGGWLCVVGAPVAKYIRPGEGQIHSPSGGGYLPLGSSVVAAGRQQLADGSALPPGYIRQPEYRCANRVFFVQRPFPVCESLPRTTLVQGFSHCVTKIKVDAEHSARMPAPFLSCRCKIGGNAQKSPGQMRYRRLPPPAQDDPRRTRGTEASGTGEQRCGGPRLPRPREGCFQLRIRRFRHRCSSGGTPCRGGQGYSPLARDAYPAAGNGG